MSGKVKSLHGVYKALGRDAFLAAAKMYSDHVQKTVEATLAEMESHWYGAEKTMTEADRMCPSPTNPSSATARGLMESRRSFPNRR